MKRSFDFNLDARKFFGLFIGFWIPYIILQGISSSQSSKMQEGAAAGGGAVALSLLASLGVFLLVVLFQIPFMRRLVPATSFDGSPFGFAGSVGRYFGLNVLGIFLSVITAGIYYPWYMTRITRYLAGETSYQGAPLRFEGKGGKLFVILLLSLMVPIAAVGAYAGVTSARWGGLPSAGYNLGLILLFVLMGLIFLGFVSAAVYLVYRWLFTNLKYQEHALRWETEFWGSTAYIWGQVLLTVVTAGIYGPAAYVRLYRYFVSRTVVEKDGGRFGALAFEGAVGKGFGLMWGQGLLCLITVGIYIPWALARVGKWYLSNTSFAEGA
ncbi:MAG: DUF898 family protein [Spirochaetales bacterium]|nr:DUF898 family protein [Spirochaetales bacterium]